MKNSLSIYVILGMVLGLILGFVAGMTTVTPKTKVVTQTKIQVKTKTNTLFHSLSSGDTLAQAERSFNPTKYGGRPVQTVVAGTKFTCFYYFNKTGKVITAASEDWYGTFCVNSKLVS